MNRYHTALGTGDGIEAGLMRLIPEEENHGHWVLYKDAQAEISKSHKSAAFASVDQLETEFKRGYGFGKQDGAREVAQAAQVAEDSSDRKRLLNELYHDRARLERAVKDAVDLCETAMQLEETTRDDSEYVLGLLQQFVDTHKA
jgi:hypothetical protein